MPKRKRESSSSSLDSGNETDWPVRSILDETSNMYLLDWDGIDPDTGLPWEPSWELKENASDALIAAWKASKRAKRKQAEGSDNSTSQRKKKKQKQMAVPAIRPGSRKSTTAASPRQFSPQRRTTNTKKRASRLSPASDESDEDDPWPPAALSSDTVTKPPPSPAVVRQKAKLDLVRAASQSSPEKSVAGQDDDIVVIRDQQDDAIEDEAAAANAYYGVANPIRQLEKQLLAETSLVEQQAAFRAWVEKFHPQHLRLLGPAGRVERVPKRGRERQEKDELDSNADEDEAEQDELDDDDDEEEEEVFIKPTQPPPRSSLYAIGSRTYGVRARPPTSAARLVMVSSSAPQPSQSDYETINDPDSSQSK